MNQDDTIGLKGGLNEYKVLLVQGKNAKLECSVFHTLESLGDGIMCTHQGQQIWIAHEYHGWRFEVRT